MTNPFLELKALGQSDWLDDALLKDKRRGAKVHRLLPQAVSVY